MPSATATATPTATSTVDNRFALTITGPVNAPTTVAVLGINWWYSYGALPTPGAVGTQVAQISMQPGGCVTPLFSAATLQAAALQAPGSYWIIGNEPNVPGVDNCTGAQYATELEYYVTNIKGADPTAQIVGPNALNWDYTCTDCSPYTPGETWVADFRSAWASQYGGEPPLDVWALHTYSISWDNVPMTDPTIPESQIVNFANFLATIPADAAKPIWVTEMGVIWGYDGWTYVSSGCVSTSVCIAPVGNFDTAAVTLYMNGIVPWLTANSATYRLDRWFLYTSIGSPTDYATTYGGISLLSGSTLTSFGQLYQQYAYTQ